MVQSLTHDFLSEAVLSVANMHCGGCVRNVEGALRDTFGVLEARANLTTKRVRVQFNADAIDLTGLVRTLADAGFQAARFDGALVANDRDQRLLLRCLGVAGFAAANIMLLSVAVWAGLAQDMDSETRNLFQWISTAIALPAVAYAGRPFFQSAWTAMRAFHVNMDVPISLAVLLATTMSFWQTWNGGAETYFDAAVSLLFFLLIGRFLDASVRGKARDSVGNLLAFAAGEATLIDPETGNHRRITAGEVRPGDRVLVASGEKVPADGAVLGRSATVDTSIITGESTPSVLKAGMAVFAGSVNLGAAFQVRAAAAANDSILAEVSRLMEAAQQGRDRYVRLADRAAKVYAPLVHGLAALTFVGWLLVGTTVDQALVAAIAVLIITCPCALGLAVPVVHVIAAGRLMRRGILLKSGTALERFAGIDRVVFDKTGTLTAGRPELIAPETISDSDLKLAFRLARSSRHSLSQAIARAALDRFGFVPGSDEVEEVPGYGLKMGQVRLGSAAWCGLPRIENNETTTVVWLARPGFPPIALRFSDAVRPDAAAVVSFLQERKIAVSLLSGDAPAPVAAVAGAVGITDLKSRMTPKDKIDTLRMWQSRGERVLMVGDGLNDAPALTAADASISPASAADIAQSAADIVFQGQSLSAVPETLEVAAAARRRVLENFALAAAYNAISVPLAMAGVVSPLLAAVAMSTSSILVTVNALRLKGSPKPWTRSSS
jgi:Cu2+-exporting ATPase